MDAFAICTINQNQSINQFTHEEFILFMNALDNNNSKHNNLFACIV
jgi:hypothetical protein